MTTTDSARTLPRDRDLQYNDVLRGRTSWGVFGMDDELGTVGLIGDSEVVAAALEIRRGARFSLSLPLDEPNRPPGGRERYAHTILRPDRNSQDDRLDRFYLQVSSQWDGLRHIQAREFGFYNGVSEEEAREPGGRLGIDRWARHGIVTRAVLADVERFAVTAGLQMPAHESVAITTELLEQTLESEGVTVRRGDVLLLRTGYLQALRSASKAEQAEWDYADGCPGLVGSESMAELLWDWHVAAVCADTPAVEVVPVDPEVGFLHRRVLAMLGMALGELFDLDALAEDCAEDGRYTTFFAAVPLNLPGGVGSPANAIACK